MNLDSIIEAANAAEELGIIGMLFLVNVITVAASLGMYREVKQCRKDIVDLLRDDVRHHREHEKV